MRKADRLFQLVNCIRTHQPISARALALRLEVSERSIYRYVDDLSLSGIPIYGEPGIGYRLREDFELPPLNLTAQEVEALLLAAAMVSSSTGKQFSQAARSLLHKIEAALPAQRRPTATKAHAFALHDRTLPAQRWDLLWRAIDQGAAVELDYVALDGQRSQRIVHPLGLFYWGGKWTLGAWCGLRGAYRDFRLDRIAHSRTLESAPALPNEVSLGAYMRIQAEVWRSSQATDTTLSVAPA